MSNQTEDDAPDTQAVVTADNDERLPEPRDLLSDPAFRARFEQTSAALEAADLVRRMRQVALSTTGMRGISQAELAERAGLSQPRISQIENGFGRDGVSYAVLRKIANACGIEWGQLLRRAIAGIAEGKPSVTQHDAADTRSVARARDAGTQPSLGAPVRIHGSATDTVASVLSDER